MRTHSQHATSTKRWTLSLVVALPAILCLRLSNGSSILVDAKKVATRRRLQQRRGGEQQRQLLTSNFGDSDVDESLFTVRSSSAETRKKKSKKEAADFSATTSFPSDFPSISPSGAPLIFDSIVPPGTLPPTMGPTFAAIAPTMTPSTEAPTMAPILATIVVTPSPTTASAPPTIPPPTSPPTSTPTFVPITSSPTVLPVTLSPTMTPSTEVPSMAPSTEVPSMAPILATIVETPSPTTTSASPTVPPATSPPTFVPITFSPTVLSVTSSPTLTPSTVAPTMAPILATIVETPSPTAAPVSFSIVSPLLPTLLPSTASLDTSMPSSVSAPPSVEASRVQTPSPTSSEIFNTTIGATTGFNETACTTTPSVGTRVTEVVQFEYLLYLGPPADGSGDVQGIVDALEPKLHQALIDLSMSCSDFTSVKYAVVGLSEGASDAVGGTCDVPDGPVGTTSCHKVDAEITVTIWYAAGRRRHRHLQKRTLFGDGDVFAQFVEWLIEALAVGQDPTAGILGVAFNGFTNLDGISGNELPDSQPPPSDPTDALVESSYSATDTGLGNLSYGVAAVAVGGVVLALIVVVAATRRRRSHRAILQYVKGVDELRLDEGDELDAGTRIVDDESLFEQGEDLLPDDYEVQLEDIDHDYRTCASPTCRACLERRVPIFVATDKRDFQRHLSNLRPEKYGGQSLRRDDADSLDR